MGHEIERLAKSKGIEVVSIIDPTDPNATHREISEDALKDADVALEFTRANVVVKNIASLAKLKKNIVVGTTGWYDQLEKVREIVYQNGIGLIYSPNFSLSVNLFYRIVENACRLLSKIQGYDVFIYEIHHNKKADSPSGTAKKIAEIVLKNFENKKKIIDTKLERAIDLDELHLVSIRAGYFPGIHVIGFDSEFDTIKIEHYAKSRAGFAQGALLAAEWIKDKKGIFTMEDFLNSLL